MPACTSSGMSSTPRTPFFAMKVPDTIRLRPGPVTTWRWSCSHVNWEKVIGVRLPLPIRQYEGDDYIFAPIFASSLRIALLRAHLVDSDA